MIMFNFTNRVAVVTGAAGQLGMAVTRAFLESGAQVTCVDKARSRLHELYASRDDIEQHLFQVNIDLNDPESVAGMVSETIQRFGRLDILVNTVGGFRMGTPVHETSLETWDSMFITNARTAFITSRAVIPQMLKQGSGSILHTAARPGLVGKEGMAAYSASKSAVIRLVESMSAEYKDLGVRTNCIIPGTLDTPQNRRDMPGADTSHWVQPESLAEVILFLSSDSARDIQGAAIPVYGRN
jgi:NAD(P)-dependent dehydrogenase (short-subunit alcohol dehydrogenase family)